MNGLFRVFPAPIAASLDAVYHQASHSGVLIAELIAHGQHAARNVLEIIVHQGTDAAQRAVLHHLIGVGVAEQRGGKLAVLHGGNAGAGFHRGQVHVVQRINAVGVQEHGGDVVVAVADAVGGGDAGALEVLGGVVRAVAQDVQGLAAHVGPGHEAVLHVVCNRNQQGGDMADADLGGIGTQRLFDRRAVQQLDFNAILLKIALLLRQIGGGGAVAAVVPIDDGLAPSGLVFRRLQQLLFGHRADVCRGVVLLVVLFVFLFFFVVGLVGAVLDAGVLVVGLLGFVFAARRQGQRHRGGHQDAQQSLQIHVFSLPFLWIFIFHSASPPFRRRVAAKYIWSGSLKNL